MSHVHEAGASVGAIRCAGHVDVVRGLLWREWIAHRRTVEMALSVWLVGGWVLMIFSHPGWIIAYGVLYAWAAGQAFGGSEAAEGAEEFAFALPPTRAQRYLVRLVAGGGSVLVLTLGPLLAIVLNVPQKLWSVFVQSGFTEPFAPCGSPVVYALAVAVPLAFYAFTFAVAANASSHGTIRWAGLAGWVGTGAVLPLGLVVERRLSHDLTGCVSCPALLVLGGLALLVGYGAYVRKEGVGRAEPRQGGAVWPLRIVLLAVFLFFVLYLLTGTRG